MATIVTRSGKGSPLTNAEVDGNFTNLNTELGTKANTSSLATVATTGAYSDLTGKPTNVSSFTNDSAYITSITSGNVTTALGFTPYNAANPAGYTTNVGTVTSVSGTGTVSGLTLTGSVTGAGSLTLGGAITGFLPLTGGSLNASGVADTHQFLYNESGGEIQLIDSTGAGPILLDNVSGLARLYKVGTGAMSIGTTGANYLQFITNGSDRLRIDASGNVLINRSSTSGIGKLNVEGGADVTSGNVTIQAGYGIAWRGDQARIMTPEDNSYGALIRWGAGGGCRFFESTTERMRIDGTGSVTANVDVRAPIFYDSANTAYYLDPTGSTSLNAAGNLLASGNLVLNNGANRYVRIGSATNYSYDLQTTGDDFQIIEAGVTPRLTIKYPTGFVGLNTASPSANLEAFGVDASIITHHSGQSRGGIAALSGARIALTTTTSNDDLVFGYAASPITSASFVPSMTIDNGSGIVTAATAFNAPVFNDSVNSAFYIDPKDGSNLGGTVQINGGPVYRSDWTTRFQSGSDFVDGTLVTTDIPATGFAGESFVIEITGKSYNQDNPPFKVVAQGYLYNDTIINYSGISYAGNFATYIKVFQDGGVLKFWWPRISYWNSFNVNVMAMDGPTNNTISRNRVTAIGNAVEPTGTKKVQITLTKTLKTGDAAGSISGFNNPVTAPTANTIVYRDSAGDISAREIVLSSGLSAQTPTVLVSMYPATNQMVRTTPAAVSAAIQGAASGSWGISVTGSAATASKATNLNQARYSNTDFNTLGSTGQFFRAYTNYIPSGGSYNQPPNGSGDYKVIQWGDVEGGDGATAGNWGGQIVQNFYTDQMWFRRSYGTTWQAWREFIHDGNYTSFAMPIGSSATNSVDVRAPIFYDSNDTSYYVNPNEISRTHRMGANYFETNNDVSVDTPFGLYFNGGLSQSYGIFRESGAWSHPYPDLRIAFHTGIKMGALAGYGGMRFYTNSDMATQVMSINNSADGLGGGHVFVNDVLQAGGSLRAPIFYKSDDTISRWDGNALVLRGASPTLYLRDTDHNSAMIHCNSNLLYVLRGGNDTETWATVGSGSWPLVINLTNNDITGGGTINAVTDMRAPIFYDSANTAYFVNPNGTSYVSGEFQIVGSGYNSLRITSSSTTQSLWVRAGYNSDGSATPAVSATNVMFQSSGSSAGTFSFVSGNTLAVSIGGDTATVANYLTGTNSLRAPVFYDSNDTGYYLDAASTSRINQINYTALYSASSTDYGIVGNNGFFDTVNSGVDADALELCYVRGSEVRIGTGGGNKAIRASLFYKGTNTAYYLDPTAIQSLRTVGDWRSDSSAWTGEFNGKIQYHANHWYFQSAGQWIFRKSDGQTAFEAYQNGTAIAYGDMRSPLFYDNNNTGYYADPNGTSRMGTINSDLLRSYTNVFTDQNHGYGLVGVYSSYRYQGVFAMGDSYKLPADGTTTGSLYGICWSHPNAGGVAGNLNSHGALFLENGSFLAAVSGSIRSRDDMRSPIFYDSNNTGYYADLNSGLRTGGITADAISSLTNVTANGYLMVGNGQASSDIYMLDSDEGTRRIHCNSNRIGFLTQGEGWGSFCSDNGDWTTEATGYAASSFRAPIFYDSNDTAWYVNPNSDSNLNTLRIRASGISLGSGNSRQLEINNAGSGACNISFHREGAYGAHFGLDTDNWFSTYGWSAGGGYTAMRVGSFYAYGSITATDNVTAYSDIRIKANVETIPNALDKLDQIRGVTFTRIDLDDKEQRYAGVIAQEIEAVLPEAVRNFGDIKAVDYNATIGLLIQAVKELRDEVEMLKK